jgi:hypothetical protein
MFDSSEAIDILLSVIIDVSEFYVSYKTWYVLYSGFMQLLKFFFFFFITLIF